MISGPVLKLIAKSNPEIGEDELCPGGKGIITATDVGYCKYIERKNWNVKCKEYTKSCYTIRVCPTFVECYERHLIDRSFCCEYICV